MYPSNFPKAAPLLRIVNPNYNAFSPTPFFKKIQSKNDPKSYLLNECLPSIKTWKPSHSVVSTLPIQANVIIEVNDLVQNNFPFVSNNAQYSQQNFNNSVKCDKI